MSFATDFALVLMIALVVSLLCSEIVGVSPGGIITPAYLAMVYDSPLSLVFIFLIALLTYGIVSFASLHIILYGRRKFVFTMIVAVVLRSILGFAFPLLPFESLVLHGIGIIVPALLANQFSKQGVRLTSVSALGCTLVVVCIANLLFFVGV